MDEVHSDAVEPLAKLQSQLSHWSSIILMVAILAVAGVVSALTAMRFAIRGREVEVPQLTNKTKEEAEEMLRGRGLKLKVTSSRFSSQVAEGKVLQQDAAARTRLKVDRTVRVLLSLGEQKFAVPNLVGESVRAAQLTLAHPWRRERDVGASPVGTGKVKSSRVWPPQQTIARCFSLGAANGQTGRCPRAGADPVPSLPAGREPR